MFSKISKILLIAPIPFVILFLIFWTLRPSDVRISPKYNIWFTSFICLLWIFRGKQFCFIPIFILWHFPLFFSVPSLNFRFLLSIWLVRNTFNFSVLNPHSAIPKQSSIYCWLISGASFVKCFGGLIGVYLTIGDQNLLNLDCTLWVGWETVLLLWLVEFWTFPQG